MQLSLKKNQRIQEEYLKNEFKLEQILAVTCKVLSLLSSSAGVVLAPKKNFDTLKHLELHTCEWCGSINDSSY